MNDAKDSKPEPKFSPIHCPVCGGTLFRELSNLYYTLREDFTPEMEESCGPEAKALFVTAPSQVVQCARCVNQMDGKQISEAIMAQVKRDFTISATDLRTNNVTDPSPATEPQA